MKTQLTTLRAAAFFTVVMLLAHTLTPTGATAQENASDEPRFYMGLNLLAGIPTGEFAENVKDAGFGLTGMFGFGIGSAPVVLGIEGGYMVYGSKDRREPFSMTIPDVMVTVSTTNSVAIGHLLLRLQPQEGIVRPYLDGLAGFNYLSTRTSVNNEGSGEEEIASSTNQDDFVFSYGAGGGVMFRVHRREEGKSRESGIEDKGPAEILIDLNGRYMWGGAADYLTEDSITRNGATVTYNTKHSRTDIIAVKIGVTLRF